MVKEKSGCFQGMEYLNFVVGFCLLYSAFNTCLRLIKSYCFYNINLAIGYARLAPYEPILLILSLIVFLKMREELALMLYGNIAILLGNMLGGVYNETMIITDIAIQRLFFVLSLVLIVLCILRLVCGNKVNRLLNFSIIFAIALLVDVNIIDVLYDIHIYLHLKILAFVIQVGLMTKLYFESLDIGAK